MSVMDYKQTKNVIGGKMSEEKTITERMLAILNDIMARENITFDKIEMINERLARLEEK